MISENLLQTVPERGNTHSLFVQGVPWRLPGEKNSFRYITVRDALFQLILTGVAEDMLAEFELVLSSFD